MTQLAQQNAEIAPFAPHRSQRAVNQILDTQGFHTASQSIFDIHQTGHRNALSVSGDPLLVGLGQMKAAGKSPIRRLAP